MRARGPAVCAAAVLVPTGIAFALVVLVTAGELAGKAPWPGLIPRNGAEAAAIGSADDVLRFLAAGEDPNAPMPVRPEFISPSVQRATMLEAAVFSRQEELIALLAAESARR